MTIQFPEYPLPLKERGEMNCERHNLHFLCYKSRCQTVIIKIQATNDSQNFYSLIVYCYTLFNISLCIYLEENFNLRDHVQAQK